MAWRSHPSPAPDTEPGEPESEPVPTGVSERDIRRNGQHGQATEPETVATGNGSAASVPEPALAGAGWQPLVDQPGQGLVPARAPVAAADTPPTPSSPQVAAGPTPAGGPSPMTGQGGDAAVGATDSARQIRGRVHRPDGTGVAGAALTAIDADGHQIARGQATGDGAYRIALDAAGSYVLIASAAAHQPVATPVFVGNGPVDQQVMLTGTAALTGTVRAAGTGTPLSAAATLTNQDGDVVATTVTDPAGGYRLATLGAGHYTLVVTTEAFEVAAQAVTVAETGDTLLDVTLTGAARLAGTVRAGGRPVRDARVVLADTAGTVAASAYTDDDGHYRFTGLEAGDYNVVASGYPAVSSPVAIERGYDRHDIELAHPNGHTVDRGDQIAAAGREEQQ